MPYKYETEGNTIPRILKKSAKLSLDDKEEMKRIYKLGDISYKALGEQFGVSKSMAIYAVNPERQKRNYALRVARGGSKQYYDKDKHRETMKKHRRHKQKLKLEGKLE